MVQLQLYSIIELHNSYSIIEKFIIISHTFDLPSYEE